MAAARQAVEADPGDPSGRLNLGAALLRSGREVWADDELHGFSLPAAAPADVP